MTLWAIIGILSDCQFELQDDGRRTFPSSVADASRARTKVVNNYQGCAIGDPSSKYTAESKHDENEGNCGTRIVLLRSFVLQGLMCCAFAHPRPPPRAMR